MPARGRTRNVWFRRTAGSVGAARLNGDAPRVGTAGWSIPRGSREHFAQSGSQLERYAATFTCVEINSSFYKPHRPATYERWAASVPPDFVFSLKLPKAISHVRRLAACEDVFDAFLLESAGLGAKRAVLLLQLPPSFAFERAVVCAFFEMVRARYDGLLACEPRHATWFAAAADDDLRRYHVGRVAADPARVPEAGRPGGWEGFAYYRWHGSPRTYYSAYGAERVAEFAELVRAAQRPAWCIFDNTTLGAATEDARTFAERWAASRSSRAAQGNGQIR